MNCLLIAKQLIPTAALTAIFSMSAVMSSPAETTNLKWQPLPSVPDHVGFAGPFAGVSNGALLVAGGANFPGAMPWDGGQKVWHDSIFVLPKPDGAWLSGFKLARPIAYGVSVTTSNGIICAGGGDAHENFRDVFELRWINGRIETKTLPPLPEPMANGCGALVGDTIYLAGGIDRPDATNALRNFWAIKLGSPHPEWQELPPWPGPSRMLAVAGSYQGDFYLFSGASLSYDAAGKPMRQYLNDAYRFHPGTGWARLANLPRAAVAAPSPAIVLDHQLLIVSGDDGKLVNFEPKPLHPGFPRDVLAYDPAGGQWESLGESPLSRATAPVVDWHEHAVVVNGEARPGYRTPQVWELLTHLR